MLPSLFISRLSGKLLLLPIFFIALNLGLQAQYAWKHALPTYKVQPTLLPDPQGDGIFMVRATWFEPGFDHGTMIYTFYQESGEVKELAVEKVADQYMHEKTKVSTDGSFLLSLHKKQDSLDGPQWVFAHVSRQGATVKYRTIIRLGKTQIRDFVPFPDGSAGVLLYDGKWVGVGLVDPEGMLVGYHPLGQRDGKPLFHLASIGNQELLALAAIDDSALLATGSKCTPNHHYDAYRVSFSVAGKAGQKELEGMHRDTLMPMPYRVKLHRVGRFETKRHASTWRIQNFTTVGNSVVIFAKRMHFNPEPAFEMPCPHGKEKPDNASPDDNRDGNKPDSVAIPNLIPQFFTGSTEAFVYHKRADKVEAAGDEVPVPKDRNLFCYRDLKSGFGTAFNGKIIYELEGLKKPAWGAGEWNIRIRSLLYADQRLYFLAWESEAKQVYLVCSKPGL